MYLPLLAHIQSHLPLSFAQCQWSLWVLVTNPQIYMIIFIVSLSLWNRLHLILRLGLSAWCIDALEALYAALSASWPVGLIAPSSSVHGLCQKRCTLPSPCLSHAFQAFVWFHSVDNPKVHGKILPEVRSTHWPICPNICLVSFSMSFLCPGCLLIAFCTFNILFVSTSVHSCWCGIIPVSANSVLIKHTGYASDKGSGCWTMAGFWWRWEAQQ